MADFPGLPLVPLADDRSSLAVSTFSGWALGPAVAKTTGAAAGNWPSANRALFVPFRVPVPVTVYQMACGTGTGTTGNFDLGIYDKAGNRVVSTGTTAKTTASSERIVNVTDTQLLPGMYYLAMSTDGVTGYVQVGSGSNLGYAKLSGMREAASSFVLPSTVTYASVTAAYMPCIAAYFRAE